MSSWKRGTSRRWKPLKRWPAKFCHGSPRTTSSRSLTMPEAVIVAAARSPIGRAFKGSLASMRPDNLAAQIVRAALDQVPQLDPTQIDDLMLGCAEPFGEQGNNL